MKRAFRKYHRVIALIVAVPLLLTLLTGILASLVEEWGLGAGIISRELLLEIHTGEIIHLAAVYPLLNGLGLLAMVVTGLSMSPLFNKKNKKSSNPGSLQ